MFGKIFECLFTGSMVGAGTHVFAVWSYVIANTKSDGHVELNATILAAILGDKSERMQEAIDYLCAPDPNSRTKDEQGRRLIKTGEFSYFVPNHKKYREMRNEEDRRAYFRDKKRQQRQREKEMSRQTSKTVKDMSNMSTHTEAEAETEEEASVSPAHSCGMENRAPDRA
jgi:hypothetical protein